MAAKRHKRRKRGGTGAAENVILQAKSRSRPRFLLERRQGECRELG